MLQPEERTTRNSRRPLPIGRQRRGPVRGIPTLWSQPSICPGFGVNQSKLDSAADEVAEVAGLRR